MAAKTPLHLTLCSQLFYPELVSTGQTLTELCEVLAQRQLHIQVLCAPPSILHQDRVHSHMTHHDIHIRRLKATQFPKSSFWGRLINQLTYTMSLLFYLLTHSDPSPLLCVTNPPFLAGFVGLIARIQKRPFIYLIFDVYPDTAIQLKVLSRFNPITLLWRFFNQVTYRCATEIIVIGRCMKGHIEAELPRSCLGKLRLIPVWANDPLIQAPLTRAQSPLLTQWPFPEKFVVLYSGNMGRFHDLLSIVKAARSLQSHSDIVFLFVGDGHQKPIIQDYVTQEQLQNCHFSPYVQRDELGTLFSKSSLGLVSLAPNQIGLSVPSKTFGLLAAGLPIIGLLPSESEIAYLLTETQSGCVSPPGDETQLANLILALYQDPQSCQDMAQNAQNAIASQYGIRHVADQYESLIRAYQSPPVS